MAASLYGLAGKPHPINQPVAEIKDAPVTEVNELVAEPQVNQEIETIEIQQAADPVVADLVNDTVEDKIEPDPEIAVHSHPVWDASWTKTKLLGIATSIGLPVTIDSSKSEIIAALTAATRL